MCVVLVAVIWCGEMMVVGYTAARNVQTISGDAVAVPLSETTSDRRKREASRDRQYEDNRLS